MHLLSEQHHPISASSTPWPGTQHAIPSLIQRSEIWATGRARSSEATASRRTCGPRPVQSGSIACQISAKSHRSPRALPITELHFAEETKKALEMHVRHPPRPAPRLAAGGLRIATPSAEANESGLRTTNERPGRGATVAATPDITFATQSGADVKGGMDRPNDQVRVKCRPSGGGGVSKDRAFPPGGRGGGSGPR